MITARYILHDFKLKSETASHVIPIRSILVLFAFSLVFRFTYLVESLANPLFGVPVADALVYSRWADRMADGIWLWDRVENYLPIYPAFLALQQIVFGGGLFVNKILQSIMGALTAVLLAQTAARTWNRQVGLITGYLIATYWMLVVFGAEKYAETFSIFFQSLTIWLLVRNGDKIWAILAAGFTFAVSAGVRANLFLVFPFLLCWLAWRNRERRGRAFKAVAIFSFGTVLITGPILLRNYQISGAPMLRAQAGWSLYSGLSPEFEGLHPPVGILFSKYMNLPNQNGAFSEKDIEHYWFQQLKKIIRENPSGVLLNFLRHLVIFANAREWSQEFDVYAYRYFSRLLTLPWTGFWLIGPFAMLGFGLIRRSSKDQVLIWIYTITSILSILPFKASDRYRLPSAALMTLFAALALWYFYQWLKARNKRALIAAVPILALACLLCWPDWQKLASRKTARHDFFVGLHYEATGKKERAIQAYEKSMREFPWDPDSPHRIGRILISQKRTEQAMDYLQQALIREPEFPQAMNAMAYIHLHNRNLAAAEKVLKKSLDRAPANIEAFMLMARLYRLKGSKDQEIELLKKAVAYTGNQEPLMLLALRLKDAGNPADAVMLYDRVMRSITVDKKIRLGAAMQAGLILARFHIDPKKADPYWSYILKELCEFKFFSSQAAFLAGRLDKHRLRRRLGKTPIGQATAEYVIGLHHRNNGDIASAIAAYRRCLQVNVGNSATSGESPLTWAREDLHQLLESQ